MRHIELSPDEKALVASVRDCMGPTELQRARVRKGLDAKIASNAAASVVASSAGLAMFLKLGVGVAIAAAVGTGVLYVAVPRPSSPAASPAKRTHQTRPTRPPMPTEEPATAQAPTVEPTPTATADTRATQPSRPHRSARRPDPIPLPPATTADLAGELALLTQASTATKLGDVARADELLRTYDQRYPSGELTPERAAAGVLAHCAGGRIQVARAEAHRFMERWPRSPLVARIQDSCAVAESTR